MALAGPVSPASQRALVPRRVLSGVAHGCHAQETLIASFHEKAELLDRSVTPSDLPPGSNSLFPPTLIMVAAGAGRALARS
jgi:hypothetical protein